jgi:hypothetical protein
MKISAPMKMSLSTAGLCAGGATLAFTAALVTIVGCGGGGSAPSSSPTTPDPTGATAPGSDAPSAANGGSTASGGGSAAPAGGGSAPSASASTCPLGPQLTIDTSTVPTRTGTTFTPQSSSDLASALAAAGPGDEIVLDASVSYTGPF